jgi:hypothetical protein
VNGSGLHCIGVDRPSEQGLWGGGLHSPVVKAVLGGPCVG